MRFNCSRGRYERRSISDSGSIELRRPMPRAFISHFHCSFFPSSPCCFFALILSFAVSRNVNLSRKEMIERYRPFVVFPSFFAPFSLSLSLSFVSSRSFLFNHACIITSNYAAPRNCRVKQASLTVSNLADEFIVKLQPSHSAASEHMCIIPRCSVRARCCR